MEPEKAERIMKLAQKLDNSAREVSYRAGHIAYGLPVDKMALGLYFRELSATAVELATELGFKK